MSASAVAWLLPAAPFLAAVAGLLLGRRAPGGPALPAVGGTAVSTLVALLVAVEVLSSNPTVPREVVTTFTPTGSVDVALGTRVDGLSASVAVMVCVVALAVQVYSVSYMAGDARYSSYAAFVSLFTAAMLLVVVSADLLQLYVGWEVMGICSYFLVGHHWELAEARSAAVKAFVVTRIGDVAFLFGIFTIGLDVGSFRVSDVLAAAGDVPTVATVLLLGGVVGKSAQFPLHTWLPDAMVGPTPISALIHAATMVAAGIFVVALLYPVYETTPVSLAVLGVVAAISMVGAALTALAQDDLKRVLAYSTVSQLAYMAGALAVGGYAAAVFHLLAHGAFKALLFLGAGVVIHAVGSNMMSDMGGLRHTQPLAFWTMTVGLGALAGVPPLAGFVSKESVLVAAEHSALGASPVEPWVGWVVLLAAMATVALTAMYAMRAWLRTFFGRPADVSHAPPPLAMGVPVATLALLTAVAGVLALPGLLPTWLGTTVALGPEPGTVLVSLALTGLGFLAVYHVWARDRLADPAAALRAARPVFAAAFGVDRAYDVAVVRPARALAAAVLRTDDDVVDATVEGSGRAAQLAGGALRLVQNGNVQAYLTGLLAGVVAIALGVVVLS